MFDVWKWVGVKTVRVFMLMVRMRRKRILRVIYVVWVWKMRDWTYVMPSIRLDETSL